MCGVSIPIRGCGILGGFDYSQHYYLHKTYPFPEKDLKPKTMNLSMETAKFAEVISGLKFINWVLWYHKWRVVHVTKLLSTESYVHSAKLW